MSEAELFGHIDDGVNKFLSNKGDVAFAITKIDEIVATIDNKLAIAALCYAKQKLLERKKEEQ